MTDCGTCRFNRGELPSPGGVLYDDGLWVLQHFGEPAPLAGWLVLKPIRHVEALADLTPAEASTLGTALQAITAAMREILGCEKVYANLYAEAPGFAHIHIHLIPRLRGTSKLVRGPHVFRLLALARYRGTAKLRGRLFGRPVDSVLEVAASIKAALDAGQRTRT